MDPVSIRFYSHHNLPYGSFSNYSDHPILVDGLLYPTNEHYFQSQKFTDPAYMESIRIAPTPGKAKTMGNVRTIPIRKDWETVKEDVMLRGLRAKFTQHEDLRKLLLQTKDAKLIESTPHDRYWADGGGTGLNRLGYCLELVRSELVLSDAALPNPILHKQGA
jgi:N-glycosidase YbiA